MNTRHRPRRFPSHRLSSASDLADVRDEFQRWLSALTADTERVAEITIVFSELGANAVEATPADRPAPRVEAWLAETGCTIEVKNHLGDVDTFGADRDLQDPLRPGRRGLLLVSAFSDEVEVEAEDDTVIVRCTATLGDARPEGP